MCENEGIRHVEIHHKLKTDDGDDEEKLDIREQTQHEQLLHGDSDQVSLDSLLKAVIDISDRLNHQEEKIKEHEGNISNGTSSKRKKHDRNLPLTAVRKYNNDGSFSSDSDLDQSQSSSQLSSRISSATSRTLRSSKYSPSTKHDGMSDSRKNISFSNDSLRQIDMENQRLLKEILHTKPKTLTQRKGKLVRPQSASAVNRQRQQKEIDRENLRLLGRLQTVKATKSLARDNLMTDHSRNKEHSSRISRSRPSSARPSSARPSSARTTCSMDTFDTSMMDMFDNESVLSSSASTRSVRSTRSARSTSSRGTNSTSKSSSRPSSGKKKVTVVKVWEPGW